MICPQMLASKRVHQLSEKNMFFCGISGIFNALSA
ncbi:hypothetical protein ACMTAS_1508 [Thermotoga neapolitana DSM 4359]